MTVPYDAAFAGHGDCVGASTCVFVKLGRRKGYRLDGAARYGFNAFFVKNGEGDELLLEVPAATCFTHRRARSMASRSPAFDALPWVQV